MKKIYMLVTAVAFVGMVNAQLLIDENFDDWTPAGAPGFTINTYGNWDYTSPNGVAFQVKNSRLSNGLQIDIERDDHDNGAGQLIFTVPSCSKIEVDMRSANNNSPEGGRYMYIAKADGASFTQVSELFPAIGGVRNIYSESERVTSEVSATFAIMSKNGTESGATRLEALKVWAYGATSIRGIREANLVIYTTPKNIKIGGDVASIEIYNLAGSVVKSSTVKGIQSISTADLKSGIYVVKALDSNGLAKVEKVIIN